MHELYLIKFKIFLVLFLGIHANLIFAQSGDEVLSNNLHNLAHFKGNDTSKAILLKNIGLQYRKSDPVLAKKYLHDAASLSELIHFSHGQIAAYNNLGIICLDIGEYDSSIYYHLKCLKIRENLNDNEGVARSYLNLGSVYENINDSTRSLLYLNKCLELSKRTKDNQLVGLAEMNMGGLYQRLKQNILARYWYTEALKVFQKTKDKANLAVIFNNIGILYANDSNDKKALIYYFQDAAIEKQLNDAYGLANVYINIATSYSNINRDSSLYYFNLASTLAKKINNPTVLMSIQGSMVSFYINHHEYEKALEAYEQYDNLKDSIFNINKQKALNEIQTKYETEKKEQQINKMAGEQKFQALLRNFLVFGLVLILIIALIMVNRYRFERRVNKIIESQKKRSDELLLNILPEETAEELKKYGKTTAKYYDEVTVLFSDIKEFSIISRKMTPQALVGELDTYFGSFDLISEKYNLEKIKTIGDAYLCAGGLSDPQKGSPDDVINAALEMQQYIEKEKKVRIEQNKPYFEIRIGIHTGPVVAGVVGIKKFAYDIWGDTVNTAARMEQYGVAGKINISEDTYQRIKDKYRCISRGNIEVKNKGVFAMYFVEGPML